MNEAKLRSIALTAKVKNVTITVEESALEWARIEAAMYSTSVSRLVGQIL
jgi:hypothetical protein